MRGRNGISYYFMCMFLLTYFPFLLVVSAYICVYLMHYHFDVVHKLFGVCSTLAHFLSVWDVGVELQSDS